MKKRVGLLFVITIIIFVLANTLYILDQRKTAIIIQFGEVVGQEITPGLKFKIPLIQDVRSFDKRVQNLLFNMSGSSEVVAFDQKTMKVDAYVKYKIVVPKKFYEAVQDNDKFRIRLESIVESGIREIIGQVKFKDTLGIRREEIHKSIVNLVNSELEKFGVGVIDVRLIRLNLPDKARNAVYERMRTEREKEAKEIRAMGHKEGEIIKATADKEKTVIIAEAKKKAEIIKGHGDSEAINTYAKAYGKDKDFYEYYKSLEVYKDSFNKNSSLVLSSDNKFLKYFNSQ